MRCVLFGMPNSTLGHYLAPLHEILALSPNHPGRRRHRQRHASRMVGAQIPDTGSVGRRQMLRGMIGPQTLNPEAQLLQSRPH
jgi:hypothetical protein